MKFPLADSTNILIDKLAYNLKYGTSIFGSTGLGITANQLGMNKKLILLAENIDKRSKNLIEVNDYTYKALINIEVIEYSKEKEKFWEFCLSEQTYTYLIERSKNCKIKYQNIKGETIVEDLNTLESRILLHEYDHILGKEFYSNYIKKYELRKIFNSIDSFNTFKKNEIKNLLF